MEGVWDWMQVAAAREGTSLAGLSNMAVVVLTAYNIKWETIETFRQAAVVLEVVFGLLVFLIASVAVIAKVGLP